MVRVPGASVSKVRRQPAQRMGYLPVSFNLDGDESIWIHAVSVGEALTARALIAGAARALSGPAHLPVDDDADRPAGRADAAARDVDAVFFFPFDLPPFVNRTLRLVQAAALHHDGDRDLAEPAARLPAAGREDDARERPDFVAVVSAVPARARVLPRRARPTSIASACRATSRRGASSTSAPIPRA